MGKYVAGRWQEKWCYYCQTRRNSALNKTELHITMQKDNSNENM